MSNIVVQEFYHNYVPPPYIRRSVEMLVDRLPEKHVLGLETVVLTNRAALSSDERRRKTWFRRRIVPLVQSCGWYERSWMGKPASIRLMIDNIVLQIPRWIQRLPIIPTLILATILYHEVGHHIHATSQPEHREREEVADRWGTWLTRQLLVSRYWYIALPVRILAPLIHKIYLRQIRVEADRTTNRP